MEHKRKVGRPRTRPVKSIGMRKALETFGGTYKLAEILGVHQRTVWAWAVTGVPVDRLRQLENATGIPRAQFRPDLFL